MKKFLVAGAFIAALLSAPVFAADMPVKAPAYVAPAPLFNWTGLYAGGQIGYQWNRDTFGDPNRIGSPVGPNSFNDNGLIGGIHGGYNYQFNAFVVGIEGDYEWASGSGQGTGTLAGLPFVTGHAALRWQGSLRGRLGYAIDRTLFYVTGGGAWGHYNLGYTFPLGAPVIDPLSKTLSGWTIGGGIEYAFAPNWTTRVEYRYTDYGSATGSIVNCCAGPPSSQHHELKANAVRVGLTYKFGGDPWVKY